MSCCSLCPEEVTKAGGWCSLLPAARYSPASRNSQCQAEPPQGAKCTEATETTPLGSRHRRIHLLSLPTHLPSSSFDLPDAKNDRLSS